MAQYRQTNRAAITLGAHGDATDTVKIWDMSISQPFKDVTIFVSSGGLVTAAGNLVWEVYYGGRWTGKPFDLTSTHTGGILQGTGNLAGAAEIAHIIWEDPTMLPANSVQNPNTDYFHSTPVVVQFHNEKASPVTVYVTFLVDTVGPNT
jgi:hypothetical protein